MLLKVLEHRNFGLEDRDKATKEVRLDAKTIDVERKLKLQRLPGIRDQIAVMEEFDGFLEPYCDEQTNDDGRDVDEEVFPGMNCLARWVCVEHRHQVLLNGFGCTDRVSIDFGRGRCGYRANGCIGRHISRSSFRAVLLHYLTASLTAI